MKEKKFDKQKLLTTVVTVILVVFFVGGFMIGLDRVQSMEGTLPPNELKKSLTDAPTTVEEAVSYLEKVIDMAFEGDPSLSFDDYFSVDSGSLTTDGSETFRSTLLFGLDNFEKHISNVEESEDIVTSLSFGSDIAKLLRVPSFEEAVPAEMSCSYIYYACSSCGQSADEQKSECEECGSRKEYLIKYRDEYEIVLVYDLSLSEAFGNDLEANFEPRTSDEILALVDSAVKDSVKIDKAEVDYNELKIVYKVNRLTDEINSLRYIKGMSVAAEVEFVGDYSELGSKSIGFNVTETHNFSFTWPALTLNNEELVIEPKNTDNLLATLTCENPLEMEVVWSSSDESIASVDSEGYIKTTKTTGEAVITATFEYLGKTYSDTCTVYVRVPVESMKMNKKSVDLSVGETITLSAKVSPSDATVKSVKWYSEDENIAVVDDKGVVTAKNIGEVVVYAVSDDGYYRSTCEVTVE